MPPVPHLISDIHRIFSLLNEAREKLETVIIRFCKTYGFSSPRMYRRIARKNYLALAKAKSAALRRSGQRSVNSWHSSDEISGTSKEFHAGRLCTDIEREHSPADNL